jgi:signal transduction histidine kinase
VSRPLLITKVAILIFLLAILVLFDRGEHRLYGMAVFALLVGYYLYTELCIDFEQIRVRGLLALHIGVYLVLSTLLIHVTTGDEESFYWFVYLFPVIAAASHLRLLATLGVAALASLLFLGQTPRALLLDPHELAGELPELLTFCALLFVVGLLVQHYASQLRDQLQRQKELNERLLDNQATLKESLTRLELAEQSLRRQETLAALGEMSAGLAHEIRNPLGIISSSAQLLAIGSGRNRPADGDLLEVILEETRRLNGLVTDFLTFGRPPTPALATVSLDDEVARAVEHLQGVARQRGLTVRADLPAKPIAVSTDATMLQQVLLNLLLNAMDASQPGQTVTVQLRAIPSGGAEIAVSDQGCGIPAEHLARVFAPFFTTKEQGTGLGLANAARLVESFDGQLQVRSTPGRGSVFTITIPSAE